MIDDNCKKMIKNRQGSQSKKKHDFLEESEQNNESNYKKTTIKHHSYQLPKALIDM